MPSWLEITIAILGGVGTAVSIVGAVASAFAAWFARSAKTQVELAEERIVRRFAMPELVNRFKELHQEFMISMIVENKNDAILVAGQLAALVREISSQDVDLEDISVECLEYLNSYASSSGVSMPEAPFKLAEFGEICALKVGALKEY